MAELSKVIIDLQRMNDREITRIMRRRLSAAARPLLPDLRASIMNIPSKGAVPYQGMPGLRAEIARCAEVWVWVNGPHVQAGVAVNAAKMPDGKKALPLYMEGVKAPWRHPLFGDRGNWQVQAPHPYFWQAVGWFGAASKRALEQAAKDITDQLNG